MASKAPVTVSSLLTGRTPLVAGLAVALVAMPILYAALAGSRPGAALIAVSLAGLVAFGAGTFLVWPMERKITWQRQLEVLGYRVGAALAAYALVGFGVLFVANAVTDQVVPLDWPTGFLRRLPFWPFYALVILSCQGVLPTPPGAC